MVSEVIIRDIKSEMDTNRIIFIQILDAHEERQLLFPLCSKEMLTHMG